MPQLSEPNDVLGKKLADLMELLLEGEITSEWEEAFIHSVTERFESGRSFTEAQLDKVNELHERYY